MATASTGPGTTPGRTRGTTRASGSGRARTWVPWAKTAAGIVITAVFLFPIYWIANASLQPRRELLSSSPPWFPFQPMLDGYADAIATQGGNLLTSLAVALCSMAVSVTVAAPCAFAIVSLRLRFVTPLIAVVLIVQMLPTVVIANALYSMYSSLGLLNTFHGLVLADATSGVPFAILILRAFMSTIPYQLFEAARVDGAGYVRTFFSVILPLSRNGLITAALFSFLFAWSDFMFALTLNSSADATPVTLGIYRFIGTQSTNWNAALATALLASIPPAILLIALQRFIAAGVTSGSVK